MRQASQAAIFVTALVTSVLANAATPGAVLAPTTLPPPSGAPQSLEATRDPLIGFVHQATDPAAFRTTVGAAVVAHPAVKEAIAVQSETRQVRAEARASLLPTVNLDLTGDRSLARHFEGQQNIIDRLRPKERVDARAMAEQLLFDFGATSNRIRAASARIKAAEADVRSIAGETAIRAVSAYYDVLAYQTFVDLGQAFIERHREILEDTRLRFRQGYSPAGDIARVEAYLADAEGRVAGYERRLAAARARYIEAFGTQAPHHVVRPLAPQSAATDYDQALALSRANPAVAAREAQTLSAKREWRAAHADGLPRLSAVVDATRYDLANENHDYDVRGRLVLRHTLFSGGRISARANQARARLQQAEFAAERVVQESARDAGIAFEDVQVLERQTETLERAYFANRRTRDLFVEQFKVSRGTLLDLLRTEQDYFEAATAYLQSVMELDVARYVLLDRTGEILGQFGVTFSFDDASASGGVK